MEKKKRVRKQLFSLILAFAMVLTSVSVPSVTAEAAKAAKVKKIQITNPKKKKVTLNKGKTLQIKVKVTPKNAKNKKVTYKTSKKKIASVSKKGKVKGLKIGTAKITVTSKENRKKKATLTVRVVTPVSKVTVAPTAVDVNEGASATLKATVAPKNAYNKKVNWTTSNKAVATVTSAGVVTGVKAGTATITAKAADGSNKKATCTVTVKAVNVTPPAQTVTLQSIAVTKAPAKTEYVRDDLFDPTGMEVTATYSNATTKVLESNAYQLSPSTETPLKTTDRQVTVSYTEGGVTQTATTPITVKAKPTVQEIAVKTMPTTTEYTEGDVFDPTGMEIEATLSDGTKKLIEEGEGGYTYSKDPLEVTVGAPTSNVTITYAVSSTKQLTAEVPVTVRAQNPLKSIAVELKQTTLEREGASFSDDDVDVTATFEDNTTKKISVTECSVEPAAFTKETTSAKVIYWYGGISKSFDVEGFVVTSYREKYTFEDENTVGTLVKRENENAPAVPTEEFADDVELAFEESGVNGKALKMDGTYGLRLDKIAGTDSKSYSISMWVKPEVMATNKALIISTASKFGLGDAGDESWCALAGNNNTSLKLWSYGENYTHVTAATAPIKAGTSAPWTHIVMTVDGTKTADGTEPGAHDALATLYVNGKKMGSGNVQNEKGQDMKTYFGVTGWSADGYYKGLVDELVFTNEVLTEEEAEAYYLDNIENTGNTITGITAVSADDGEEVTVPYGTTLADVKRALMRISYKATAGEGAPIALTPISDSLTKDDYSITTSGEVETTVKLQAPDGYLFDMGGRKAVTITRTVKIKIPAPIEITAIAPSAASVTVPYGASEDEIKEELAKLTFTVTTSDSSAYEISNSKTKWTLAEAENGGYTATFAPGDLKVGYKYADDLAPVTVTVAEKPAINITALTIDQDEILVAYGTSETGVKAELAKLVFEATVAQGEDVPVIANTAALWTIENYEATTPADYTAKATVAAPVGYAFAEGVSAEISVKVTVKPQGAHVLDNIVIETEPSRVNYLEGDEFDKTGMVVKAYYEDGQSEDVTSKVVIEGVAAAENGGLKLEDKSVTVSYSEGEADAVRTKTATQAISVVKLEEGMAVHYDFEGSLADAKGGVAATMATNKTMVDNTNTPAYTNEGEGFKGRAIQLGNGADANVIRLGSVMKSANFTINLWAKPRELKRNFAVLLNALPENDTANRQLAIYTCADGKAQALRIFNGTIKGGGETDVQNVWDTGKWSMVTWSNSDSKTHVYVDGKEIFSSDNKVDVTKIKKLFISGSPYDDVFDGYVDEVSLFDSTLNAKQVEKLYGKDTISGISTNAPEDGLTYTTSAAGNDDSVIQAALKNLKITVTMKYGVAPAIENNTDWTLTPAYNGAGTYTATKELTIPDTHTVLDGVKTTLEVPVVVKDVKLTSIAVTREPNKCGYKASETFDPAGMVVTATYDDESTNDVTDGIQIADTTIKAPAEGEDTATQEITINYTEGDNTASTTQEITVFNENTAKGAMLAARTAYYTFDDTLENSVDTSKSANVVKDGSLTDSTELPNYQATSVNGKSILFNEDPSDEKRTGIKLPDTIAADKKDFTLNLWVQPKSIPTSWGEIVCGCASPSAAWNKQLMIYMSPGSPGQEKIQLEDGQAEHSTALDVKQGVWTMLTWVNTSEGKAEFYINGEKQTVKDGLGATKGVNNFFIGAGGWTDYFHGYIDEISLYDTSLTGEQVGKLYGEFATETPEP